MYKTARCRCGACRAANTAYVARQRRLAAYGRWRVFVDATGTCRRVQALVAVGWSRSALSKVLGRDIQRLLECRSVRPETAAMVAAVYDDLWDKTPPAATGRARADVERVRASAALRGWAPPAAWDDDEIDDPNARPRGLRRTYPDVEVLAGHHRAGWSCTRIGAMYGMSRNTVAKNLELKETPR